ncbi:MAG: aldehyde dehydrogenase family protein [Bryobacterales bacterium]|nr:aldehyde dehydrogenase family protein [Bryobacterales bacterium]
MGRVVAQRAAAHLKPVLLELGGKAPLLVLEDADLDEAVKAAAFGAFMNQGQICMSTERIIVLDAVADALAEKFRAKAASMVVGDPREGKTPLGAVVDLRTVARVASLVVGDHLKTWFFEHPAEGSSIIAPEAPTHHRGVRTAYCV